MQAVYWIFAALLAFAAASDKKIVCYFGSWAVYRPGNGKIDISEIDPNLCTHLVYTFIGLGINGQINILDPWADLTEQGGLGGYNRFNQLKGRNPSMKTLIAIGGWNEGSFNYSRLASNPHVRSVFVDNAVRFVRKYGFDGLDFDWEYPNQRGGVPADKKNFVLLLRELRQRFDKENLLLSAALVGSQKSAEKSYIISEVSKYLHFINLMVYDMHGDWDKKTGIHAPLYPGSWETGDERLLNVNETINYWLSQGAPREKLILGMPTFGRTFTLVDPKNKNIGAPITGKGELGPYTREAGSLGYNEICEMQLQGDWEVHFENEQRVPYAIRNNQWVGYDNPESFKEKADFINRLDLGGAMIWSIETDDFKGICGEKYPLLSTLYRVLRGKTSHQPSKIECIETGTIPHPENCSVYYVCIPNGTEFLMYERTCPRGLYWDNKLQTCNWPDQVDCSMTNELMDIY